MADFQQALMESRRQWQDFQALQQKIMTLQQKAPFDAEARSRLERLDQMMKGGGRQLVSGLVKKVNDAEYYCKRLGVQSGQRSSPAVLSRPRVVTGRKADRQFI